MSASTHRTAGWRKFCIAGIAVCAAILPCSGLAAVNIDSIDDIDFGTWSASQGDVAGDSDFCVLSTAGNSGNARDFSVTGYPLWSGSFQAAGPGGASIPYTLTFTDLGDSSSEQLQPFAETARNKSGLSNCTGLQNARLTVSINALDLAAAPSGTYQQNVWIRARNNNSRSSFENFRITIRVSDQVRISDLDPIDLGGFDGLNDLSGVDRLCIYRNSGGTDYRIVASGDGAGGTFMLSNGVAELPYLVAYDDGNGFVGLSTGLAAAMTGANQNFVDCGGLTNAEVRVTVSGSNMATAAPGVYAGTLTLLIEPQ